MKTDPEKFLQRKGGVGAMMDEYERAVVELKSILESVTEPAYLKIVDPNTSDENCRSMQTILSHVVSAGYSYADYLREQFQMPSSRPQKRMLSRAEVPAAIDTMMNYTVETLQNRWEMSDDQMMAMRIQSRWNVVYDMEQMMEHAIVHILRHRRQIQKFLLRGN